jgi:hypothetical protein
MIDFDASVLAACDGAFGEPVEYRPIDGPPVSGIPGIFFDAFKSVRFDPATEAMVSTTHPLICCRASYFLRTPVQGELFVIRGRFFAIRDVNEDGEGGVSFPLGLASVTQ